MRTLNSIFFGKKGVTVASANLLCSMIREIIREDETQLTKMSFVHEEYFNDHIQLGTQLTLGYEADEVMAIEARLDRTIRFKQLVAWFREAIKERDDYHAFVRDKMTDKEIAQVLELEILKTPLREPDMTEQEYLDTLPQATRSRLFVLGTRAALMGKAVNENGYMYSARKTAIEARRCPTKVDDSKISRTSYIKYESSVDIAVVDEVFFRIQQRYREAQRDYNGAMYEVVENLRAINLERQQEYTLAMTEHVAAVKLQKSKIETWRKEEIQRVLNLKIEIPENLKGIYEEVKNLTNV